MSCDSVMKKWTWTLILIGVAVLLFVWSIRENFETYEEALRDVGQTPGYTDLTKPTCPIPGTTFSGGLCKKPDVNSTRPECPAGSTRAPNSSFCYGPDTMTAEQAAAAGLTFNSITNRYSKTLITTCPSGYQPSFEEGKCSDSNPTPPVCPSGTIYFPQQAKCVRSDSEEGRIAKASTRPGGADGSTPKTETDLCKEDIASKEWDKVSDRCKSLVTNTGGNSTGGSSTAAGSSAGGSILPQGFRKGNIWGPGYTGMGDNAGDGLGSGSRDYPTLLGPEPKESVMVEGAGIAPPSIHTTLAKKGGLPSSGSTGSDEQSKFFGASRLPATGGASTVPGDQDMYPGYFGGAGSTAFTASSGSSKTDPVPFLADFSAFTK